MYINCQGRDCSNDIPNPKPGKRFCSIKCRELEKGRRFRDKKKQLGLCPLCGKEWIEPKRLHFNKPIYCRHCQIERNKYNENN